MKKTYGLGRFELEINKTESGTDEDGYDTVTEICYREKTKDRLNKASFFWTMLTGKANKAKSASTTISFADKTVSLESIIDKVKQVLAESFKDNYKLYGYSIKVRKKRGVHFQTL